MSRESLRVFLTGVALTFPLAAAVAVVVYKALGGTHARTH